MANRRLRCPSEINSRVVRINKSAYEVLMALSLKWDRTFADLVDEAVNLLSQKLEK